MRKIINNRFRIFVLLVAIAFSINACSNANAPETISEDDIIQAINEFSRSNNVRIPESYNKLWASGLKYDIPYLTWKSIQNSGDRYLVDWSKINYFDSYQETISLNEESYNCGIITHKVNNNENWAALRIFYFLDSSGKLIDLRDNWSRELSPVPDKAKVNLKHYLIEAVQNYN